MNQPAFPDYALKTAEAARKQRLALPPALRLAVDQIEAELCQDPEKYPDRLIPASQDGRSRIYQHPEPSIQVTFEVDDAAKVIYIFHYFAPTMNARQPMFISYAHADKEFLAELRLFLSAIEKKGLINFWDDSQLVPGVPWEKQIKEVLDRSEAGLLLVTQNFLASQFVADVELPKLLDVAQQAGKKIYWLHVSPSTVFDTHTEITAYQSLQDDPKVALTELDEPKRKRALADITGKLMKHARLN
ncbi:hypothetical protein GCM10023165_42090 [Variovorax defluvii]|uniref:TIR domain-containing protein n=1 Tax=Variovorax defluvii TaxID=913761 RepID=A0ABP8I6Y0_9BURK